MGRLREIKNIFDNYLLKGNPSVLTDGNIAILNLVAMQLYGEDSNKFSQDDIECLKYIIMICNLLYNRTDMRVLPIEDGVYDLLLEKYKKFDSNFQVGSAIVEFRAGMGMDSEVESTHKRPIYYYDKQLEKNEVSQYCWDSIMDPRYKLYREDIVKPLLQYDPGYITKRTHNTKHNHPSLIGTLDKCKFVTIKDAIDAGCIDDPNVKILERDFFQEHIKKGIISPTQILDIVIELKYDGISVEADCTNRVLSARTRGDTGIGEASDISPMLVNYKFPHGPGIEYGVKFEAIMKKTDLYYYNIEKGYNYSNCRMAIIGLFNSSDAWKYTKYITLIPIAIDDQSKSRIDNIEMSNALFRSKGEPLRYCRISGTYDACLYQIEKFLEEATLAREYLDFMYDGIVVTYNDITLQEKLGRENFINKWQMAVKFNPMCKTTRFRGYTYSVGQNGNVVPILHYDPVEFYGTIHTKCTGASYARFMELALREGDLIDVTYRNDVMPYVTKPDNVHNRENPNPVIMPPEVCPACGQPLSISKTNKNLVCTNMRCKGRLLAKSVNMLSKLNIKGFGDSTINLIEVYSLEDFYKLNEEDLTKKIGPETTKNLIASLQNLKTEPIYDYNIIGSLGFTNIATKKWQVVFKAFSLPEFIELYKQDTFRDILANIKGLGPVTANTIADEMEFFIDDIRFINQNFNVQSSKNLQTSKQIRFSGCRNLQLEKQLCNAGYDASSSASVTKSTDILLVPYEGYTSTKTQKIPSAGQIVPIEDFITDMGKYLN